jgi:ABC-type spermidine/putrescine transport system permease subunit I
VQFNAVGNWPLGAALSLVGMAMVAVIAGLFVAWARAATKAAR